MRAVLGSQVPVNEFVLGEAPCHSCHPDLEDRMTLCAQSSPLLCSKGSRPATQSRVLWALICLGTAGGCSDQEDRLDVGQEGSQDTLGPVADFHEIGRAHV